MWGWGPGGWRAGCVAPRHVPHEEVEAWRKGSPRAVGRELGGGAGAKLRALAPPALQASVGAGQHAEELRPVASGPEGSCHSPHRLGRFQRGPETPSSKRPGTCPLSRGPRRPWALPLARPGPSPFPAAEVGPGSLGRAACSAVGLTGPLCVETEAPFMGATGPGPVENEGRPHRERARALGSKKKSISLSPQVGAGDFGGSWDPGLGRCRLWGAFLGEGRGGRGRLPALQLREQDGRLPPRWCPLLPQPLLPPLPALRPLRQPRQPVRSSHEEGAAPHPSSLGGVLCWRRPGQGLEPERARGPADAHRPAHPAPAAAAAQPAGASRR